MSRLAISSLFFISTLLTMVANANENDYNKECIVDYSVMYVVAQNERHSKRDIGYPYLISFNSQNDVAVAKKSAKLNWLDNRTVDCRSTEQCKEDLRKINSLSIENLDLGAFQINQRWFGYEDKEEYFNLRKSYKNACNILLEHYKQTGEWSWKTIARYHSKTQKHNNMYKDRLVNNFKNIKTEEEEI